MMKRPLSLAISALFLVILIGVGVWMARRPASDFHAEPTPAAASEPLARSEQPIPDDHQLKQDLSADYLIDYANTNKPPIEDLLQVFDVVEALRYKVKAPEGLPTEGNRAIVRALLGDNQYRIRFLNPDSPHLTRDGELADRWGSPLYFHFVSASEPEIRSAGPDRVLWTRDDVWLGEFDEVLEPGDDASPHRVEPEGVE